MSYIDLYVLIQLTLNLYPGYILILNTPSLRHFPIHTSTLPDSLCSPAVTAVNMGNLSWEIHLRTHTHNSSGVTSCFNETHTNSSTGITSRTNPANKMPERTRNPSNFFFKCVLLLNFISKLNCWRKTPKISFLI